MDRQQWVSLRLLRIALTGQQMPDDLVAQKYRRLIERKLRIAHRRTSVKNPRFSRRTDDNGRDHFLIKSAQRRAPLSQTSAIKAGQNPNTISISVGAVDRTMVASVDLKRDVIKVRRGNGWRIGRGVMEQECRRKIIRFLCSLTLVRE